MKIVGENGVIERLNGEFRRRVKTQASLPTEDAGLVILFSLVASGQIKLQRIDGWQEIAQMLSQHATPQRNRRATCAMHDCSLELGVDKQAKQSTPSRATSRGTSRVTRGVSHFSRSAQ